MKLLRSLRKLMLRLRRWAGGPHDPPPSAEFVQVILLHPGSPRPRVLLRAGSAGGGEVVLCLSPAQADLLGRQFRAAVLALTPFHAPESQR